MSRVYTSFIQVYPFWCQCSQRKNPITFSLSPPLCAVVMDFFYRFHLQVSQGMVCLAEMGCNWLEMYYIHNLSGPAPM